jgi:fucose permease
VIQQVGETRSRNMATIKALTFLMFMMFAMTTDSVGIIIPEVIKTFGLSMTAAGTFQYATMTGIALAGLLLGGLADSFGRKWTILVGLSLFAASCYLFTTGNSFVYFSILLALGGIGIGVFKTGALALIGDLSQSTRQHTSLMNTVEGFLASGPSLDRRFFRAFWRPVRRGRDSIFSPAPCAYCSSQSRCGPTIRAP